MILEARHNWFLYPFFTWYGKAMCNYHFKETVYNIPDVEPNKALLYIANHFSWWDGFFVQNLNMKLYKKKLYFMMLENMLRKHWYFQHTGGFSVHKGSRSIVESLHYASSILENNNNALLIFPQGRIKSMLTNTFHFEKGTDSLLRRVNSDITVLFIANIIEYKSFKKPSLYVYVQDFNKKIVINNGVENLYNAFFKEIVNKHNNTF